MKSTPAMELFLRRPQKALIDASAQLRELYEFACAVGDHSPLLRHWFLSSDKSKQDALLYEAFDGQGPTVAALAVLCEKSKGVSDVRSISLWNGAESDAETATLNSRVNTLGRPDTVEFALRVAPDIDQWEVPVGWMKRAIAIWHPNSCSFSPCWYSDHKVFEDRPGVGWMLYLPRALSVQQVPEARALVPVDGLDASGKNMQIGTIIVSVTDEPFSDENLEHVKIANAIEIRLADQDLLPRYADL